MPTERPFAFPCALRRAALSRVALAGFATLLAGSLVACKSNSASAPIVNNAAAADPGGPDPAAANLAGSSTGQPTQVMGQSQSYAPQQQAESYSSGQQAPAPIQQGYPQQGYPQQGYTQPAQPYNNGAANYDQGYAAGEAAEAATAPPPLPEYDQPPAPDPNDIWTPGYWNYGDGGYYWVPGTWVAAPYYGALWTPPYWGYGGGHYLFHHGYWGPHIGYYGGIDYGFGYVGVGYYGGYWRGHDFFYNREVNHVGSGFGNVYERPVVVNNIRYNIQPTVRVSFNGGPGGIHAQPRPFEIAAEREQHIGPVPAQVALRQQAATNRGNFYAQNQGRPAQVAFAHPPDAGRALPANTPGRPGEVNQPGQPFNRPGGPTAQPFNRPGEPAMRGGTPAQPGYQPVNRPGEPNFHAGPAPQPVNRPGEPAGNPTMNRPGEPNTHAGTPAQPMNRPAAPANNPGANRPGGFNNPGPNRPAPAPAPAAQPRVNQPGPGFNRPAPQANPGGNRTAPAAAPHVEAARPAPAPAPHGDAPRPAPAAAPHVEAARPAAAPAPHAEAPRPAAAPAPHAAPAAGGHPESGVHPGPR